MTFPSPVTGVVPLEIKEKEEESRVLPYALGGLAGFLTYFLPWYIILPTSILGGVLWERFRDRLPERMRNWGDRFFLGAWLGGSVAGVRSGLTSIFKKRRKLGGLFELGLGAAGGGIAVKEIVEKEKPAQPQPPKVTKRKVADPKLDELLARVHGLLAQIDDAIMKQTVIMEEFLSDINEEELVFEDPDGETEDRQMFSQLFNLLLAYYAQEYEGG